MIIPTLSSILFYFIIVSCDTNWIKFNELVRRVLISLLLLLLLFSFLLIRHGGLKMFIVVNRCQAKGPISRFVMVSPLGACLRYLPYYRLAITYNWCSGFLFFDL